MGAIDRAADRSGKKLMFAFNLTGEIDEMRRRHDLVLALGGTCVMANLTGVGLAGFLALARHSALPLHAHRNGWGALARHPALGFDYVPWAKVWRLAGADHMHVNGLRNKFCEPDDSVIRSARSMLEPMFASKPCTVDAGLLLRPVGGPGPRHLRRPRLARPDLRRRRRHHGPSRRPGRRRRRAPRRLGRRPRRRVGRKPAPPAPPPSPPRSANSHDPRAQPQAFIRP